METREDLLFLAFDAFVFIVGLGRKVGTVLDQVWRERRERREGEGGRESSHLFANSFCECST